METWTNSEKKIMFRGCTTLNPGSCGALLSETRCFSCMYQARQISQVHNSLQMLSTKSSTPQKLTITRLSNLVQKSFQNIAHLLGRKNAYDSKNFERPYLKNEKLGKI